MINILLTGIGGQGTVLAAKLLASAASAHGWQVRSAETIGMAQRGGSVTSHVRIAGVSVSAVVGENTVRACDTTAIDSSNSAPCEQVFSSLIPLGSADLIVAFEPAEAARVLPYLAPAGTLVTATSDIQPVTVALSGVEYSSEKVIADIRESLRADDANTRSESSDAPVQHRKSPAPKFIPVNDAEILREVGNSRTLNTVLLTIALSTGAVPLTIDDLKDAVRACVKPQFVDLNLRAVDIALRA